LIADLGDAYCEQLRRTAIGAFAVADADPQRPVGLGEALAFLPEAPLDAELARRAAHGVRVPWAGPDGGPMRLTCQGQLIALAEPVGGELRPLVGLRQPEELEARSDA
jgi:tRNA pseudouridine55 synthase